MKPIIGIPECYKFENYKYAVKKHGGEVIILYIGDEVDMTKLDGLLLPGGGDIAPERYHEPRHPKTKYVNEERDEFEISLFNEVMEKDIPVFGICRGIQIMNVAMGGSLYQHIPDQVPETLPSLFPDFPIHKEYGDDTQHKITTGSRLSQIIGESTAEVNSSHYQAVKVISDELVVTAQSKDGIIEAMEYPSESDQFVLGVQYHPERMWIDKTPSLCQREFLEHAKRLFGEFINAASR